MRGTVLHEISGRFDLSVYVLLLQNSACGHLGYVTNTFVPASLSSLESGFNIHLQFPKLFSKKNVCRPTTNSVEGCTYAGEVIIAGEDHLQTYFKVNCLYIVVRERCPFICLLAYEFHYSGHLFTRKCYVCEQSMNVHGLFMSSSLSKFELQRFKILRIVGVFSTI